MIGVTYTTEQSTTAIKWFMYDVFINIGYLVLLIGLFVVPAEGCGATTLDDWSGVYGDCTTTIDCYKWTDEWYDLPLTHNFMALDYCENWDLYGTSEDYEGSFCRSKTAPTVDAYMREWDQGNKHTFRLFGRTDVTSKDKVVHASIRDDRGFSPNFDMYLEVPDCDNDCGDGIVSDVEICDTNSENGNCCESDCCGYLRHSLECWEVNPNIDATFMDGNYALYVFQGDYCAKYSGWWYDFTPDDGYPKTIEESFLITSITSDITAVAYARDSEVFIFQGNLHTIVDLHSGEYTGYPRAFTEDFPMDELKTCIELNGVAEAKCAGHWIIAYCNNIGGDAHEDYLYDYIWAFDKFSDSEPTNRDLGVWIMMQPAWGGDATLEGNPDSDTYEALQDAYVQKMIQIVEYGKKDMVVYDIMTQTDAKKVLTGIAPFLIQDGANILDIVTEANAVVFLEISNFTNENVQELIAGLNATGIGSYITTTDGHLIIRTNYSANYSAFIFKDLAVNEAPMNISINNALILVSTEDNI